MNEYTFRCCELDSLAAKQAAMHVRSCFFLLARVARRRIIGGGTSHAPHSGTKEFFVIFRAASAVVLEEVVGEAKEEEEEGEGEEEEGTTAGIRLRGRGRRLARCGRGSIGPLFPSMSKQLIFYNFFAAHTTVQYHTSTRLNNSLMCKYCVCMYVMVPGGTGTYLVLL